MPRLRRTALKAIADVIGFTCGLWAAATASYLEWLWSASPRLADPSTNHTVLMKAVYVTPQQAWWSMVPTSLGLLVVITVSLLLALGGHDVPNDVRRPKTTSALWIAWGLLGVGIGVTPAGAHLVSLVSTGSWNLVP